MIMPLQPLQRPAADLDGRREELAGGNVVTGAQLPQPRSNPAGRTTVKIKAYEIIRKTFLIVNCKGPHTIPHIKQIKMPAKR